MATAGAPENQTRLRFKGLIFADQRSRMTLSNIMQREELVVATAARPLSAEPRNRDGE
jgi:hypothetical protein